MLNIFFPPQNKRSSQYRFYLGQTTSVWTSSISASLFPLPFRTCLLLEGRRFLVVKTNLRAKWKTCLHGVGQASACCWVTDANIDKHSHVVPGGHLYLNMGERSKTICGLLVNCRLVSRKKSAQGEWCCNSCVGSSTQCAESREWHGGAQYLMVTVWLRLPRLCYHVGICTCWHLHTRWSRYKCNWWTDEYVDFSFSSEVRGHVSQGTRKASNIQPVYSIWHYSLRSRVKP